MNEKELSKSLTILIKQACEANRKIKKGDSKLDQIEESLEEIADDVRKNLSAIFQRGETFQSLQQKSDDMVQTSK